MAFFGSGLPIFTTDGVTITLPTPATRYEFPKKISNKYININNNLIVVNIGYRMTLRMIFADMSSSEFEDVIAVDDAKNLSVRFGGLGINHIVKVTDIDGEMDGNRDVNEVLLEVQTVGLIKGIPNTDLYFAARKIINGAIYMEIPNQS